jgi:nitric oxide reductase activation protein
MQLQDLTSVLSGTLEMNFEYGFGVTVNVQERKVTGSRFWEKLDESTKENGLKSDVFLRTLGTIKHTSIPAIKSYEKRLRKTHLQKFGNELFTLLEDLRLEEIIKKERPGTGKIFTTRTAYFQHFFAQQLQANITRSRPLDELFCMIYLLLQSDEPEPSFPRADTKQETELGKLKPFLYSIYEAASTEEVTRICESVLLRLEPVYKIDAVNEYFLFPVTEVERLEKNTLFDELTRTDELVNDDVEEVNKEESESFDQKFSSWHRESRNENRKQNFLQFELEQGTKSTMLGGGARETEDADQALASIQGSSGESKEQDYSKLEVLEKQDENRSALSEYVYGEENAGAVKKFKIARTPTREEEEQYQQFVSEIEMYVRRLANTLKKTLEHQKMSPRKDLLTGRLSKKLLSVMLEDNPRIFYKKNEESKDFDAVFTLLVDCSASMVGKMEETKKGIVLFHEVLKQLHIPHSIVGFWEDANEVKADYQPNYFHLIQTHEDSLYENNGPKILQLEPEEDNRDGFSIRVAAEKLETRREKHKFLLVFSDEEPAAAGYDQNGIIDTHQAVSEVRKRGIDVIGMFLAEGEAGEKEEFTMRNIYGKEHMIVPSVTELPEHFAPILKKLLLQTI